MANLPTLVTFIPTITESDFTMNSEQRDVLSLKITYALHDVALALCEVSDSLTYDALVKKFRSWPKGDAVESLGALIESAHDLEEVTRQREAEC